MPREIWSGGDAGAGRAIHGVLKDDGGRCRRAPSSDGELAHDEQDGRLRRDSNLAIAEKHGTMLEVGLELALADVVLIASVEEHVEETQDLGVVAVPDEWVSIQVGWHEDVVGGGVLG